MVYLGKMKCFPLLIALLLIKNLHAQEFFTGRSTGQLPYMEYGLGDDRLGGAKMTYLDTGIALKVVDSFQNDYKVRLSERHFAWMPKTQIRTDSALKFHPFYLSSSWRVYGDDHYDYVSIGLPEKLPYRSFQEVNPSRIMVDIFGVTSNTNWITQLKTVKEIGNVWYEQIEDDVFRVIIELKHRQHWGYAIYYNKNALQIRVKRQPPQLKAKKLTVAIDAGHGGSNNGATGLNSKINEKDYTILIAKRLERYLRCKKLKVIMTRTEDADLSMIDRTMLLKNADPDILISIHLNSASNTEVNGTSTYYRYIGFRSLSQKILDRMLELGLKNYGNIGAFNFSLSGPTEYPNCLVEVAFLSNAEDEKRILDPGFHKDVSKKIYKGIKDWLNQCKKS